MTNQLELTTIAADLNHPEGVAWGPDGMVYAGGENGEIYRLDLTDGACQQFANTGGCVLGLALDAAANVYACDFALRTVVRISPDGSCSPYSAGSEDRPMRLPNYPVFDADGNLYVSDSGDWAERNGLIWRIQPGGDAEAWEESATGYPNGMCLAADAGSLCVVESSPPLISRIGLNDDGSAGRREVIVELPRTVPDGVALDQDGNLFIALYNPNIIYRLSAGGELTVMYDDWEQLTLMAPTNIAYAGSGLGTLVIANLGGRNLNVAAMDVPGLPLAYPKVD